MDSRRDSRPWTDQSETGDRPLLNTGTTPRQHHLATALKPHYRDMASNDHTEIQGQLEFRLDGRRPYYTEVNRPLAAEGYCLPNTRRPSIYVKPSLGCHNQCPRGGITKNVYFGQTETLNDDDDDDNDDGDDGDDDDEGTDSEESNGDDDKPQNPRESPYSRDTWAIRASHDFKRRFSSGHSLREPTNTVRFQSVPERNQQRTNSVTLRNFYSNGPLRLEPFCVRGLGVPLSGVRTRGLGSPLSRVRTESAHRRLCRLSADQRQEVRRLRSAGPEVTRQQRLDVLKQKDDIERLKNDQADARRQKVR